MANAEHLKQLSQGVDAWNAWRAENPLIRPDLDGSKLSLRGYTPSNHRLPDLGETDVHGMCYHISGDFGRSCLQGVYLDKADAQKLDFSRANLRGGSLIGADLQGVYLRGADLRGVYLIGANLGGALLNETDLRGARLRGADLSLADLQAANIRQADLRKANLVGTTLQQANLVDACLDGADLTGARLWEIQRSDWSIKDIVCHHAFWDRQGNEPTKYRAGEFERIFSEKPRIILRYPGGMSPVDLLALPLVVERLQIDHPGSVIQVHSVQNDAGGASVTITVGDLASRGREEFGQELVRLQAKLECIVDERERLQQRFDSMISDGISRIAGFLAMPRQEIHLHNPTGLTAIGGPTVSRDNYNISGQAGAVGPGAHAHDNTFQQLQSGIDLPKLAEELGRLREAMKVEATGEREQDKAIGVVADAEEAATKGDSTAVLQHLKSAGMWTLKVAEKIGVPVAIEVLKQAL